MFEMHPARGGREGFCAVFGQFDSMHESNHATKTVDNQRLSKPVFHVLTKLLTKNPKKRRF